MSFFSKVKFSVAFILILKLTFVRCFYIQKCCSREQQLDRAFRHCINFDGNEGIEKYETNTTYYDKDGVNFIKLGQSDGHHLWWLPKDIRFVSSKTYREIPYDRVHDLQFRYNRSQPCVEPEYSIVPFNDNVFLLDNGALLVTDVDDNLRPKTVIYPAYTYCLDRVSLTKISREVRSTPTIEHSFAILLCPCLVLDCVRLCCQRKFFLNVTNGNENCQYSHNLSPAWNLTYADYDGEEISRGGFKSGKENEDPDTLMNRPARINFQVEDLAY